MQYYHQTKTESGLIISIDNIVLDFIIHRQNDRDRLAKLLDTMPLTQEIDITHWDSLKIGTYHDQFRLAFKDGSSCWLGCGLMGKKTFWERIRLDFNPNKVCKESAFQELLRHLYACTHQYDRSIKRYDLAVDVPIDRFDCWLVKDNRAYIERRHGSEFTQYLGAKSSHAGRVKLYNKQVESHLPYPLTRLELTLEPGVPYAEINWPTVYCLKSSQLCIDERITDTDRFIINSILQGCGSSRNLGRKMREKIDLLLKDYVSMVSISERDYSIIQRELLSYIRP